MLESSFDLHSIITQVLGFIALTLGVYAFFQKDDRDLKIALVAQASFLCIHFIMLNALMGAVGAFISGARTAFSLMSFAGKMAPVFYILIIIFGYLTYQSPVSLLPLLSSLIATTAFYFLQGRQMRMALVCSSSCWLLHNILVGSIGPAMMELFMICALVYRIHKMQSPNS